MTETKQVRNKTGDHQIQGSGPDFELHMAAPNHFSPKKQVEKKGSHWSLSRAFLSHSQQACGVWSQGSFATSEQKVIQPYFIQMTWSYTFPREFWFLKELRCEVETCSCMVMAWTHRPFHGKMRGNQESPKLQLLSMVLFLPAFLARGRTVRQVLNKELLKIPRTAKNNSELFLLTL